MQTEQTTKQKDINLNFKKKSIIIKKRKGHYPHKVLLQTFSHM